MAIETQDDFRCRTNNSAALWLTPTYCRQPRISEKFGPYHTGPAGDGASLLGSFIYDTAYMRLPFCLGPGRKPESGINDECSKRLAESLLWLFRGVDSNARACVLPFSNAHPSIPFTTFSRACSVLHFPNCPGNFVDLGEFKTGA